MTKSGAHRMVDGPMQNGEASKSLTLALRDLKLVCCRIYFCRPTQIQHIAYERALDLVSGTDFEYSLQYMSNRTRTRFRPSWGPPWAPVGRRSTEKPGAVFVWLVTETFGLSHGLLAWYYARAMPALD